MRWSRAWAVAAVLLVGCSGAGGTADSGSRTRDVGPHATDTGLTSTASDASSLADSSTTDSSTTDTGTTAAASDGGSLATDAGTTDTGTTAAARDGGSLATDAGITDTGTTAASDAGSAGPDSGACRVNAECGAPIDPPCLLMSTCPCSFFEPTCVSGGCTVREVVVCR